MTVLKTGNLPDLGNTIAAQPGDEKYLKYTCMVLLNQDQRRVRVRT